MPIEIKPITVDDHANDNTKAIRYYQKRGMVITAVHLNALAHSRTLKPEIPNQVLFGQNASINQIGAMFFAASLQILAALPQPSKQSIQRLF